MKRGDKGQMKMSFGMIFSMIMIIIFIGFSFYAITKFLDLQNSAQIGKFVNELESDVDSAWKGSQSSQKHEYSVPRKVEYVCFINYDSRERGRYNDFYIELNRFYNGNENLFFYPPGSGQGIDSREIRNLDIRKITETENPFCIEKTDGRISLTIKKDFGEALVTITR